MSEHVYKVIHRDGPGGDDTRLVARCGDLATAQRLCDVHNGRPLRWERVDFEQWQAGRIVDVEFGLRYYAVLQERIYSDNDQERGALIEDAMRPMESFERGWQEAMDGETHPIETLWDGIDASTVKFYLAPVEGGDELKRWPDMSVSIDLGWAIEAWVLSDGRLVDVVLVDPKGGTRRDK